MGRRSVKAFTKRKGWMFPLKGGPYEGHELRIGWMLPSGERIPLDDEIRYPTGVVYRRQHAKWRSSSGDHSAGDLRFNKDNTPYYEYVWVEGTGHG